jgi:hypothetical protein
MMINGMVDIAKVKRSPFLVPKFQLQPTESPCWILELGSDSDDVDGNRR